MPDSAGFGLSWRCVASPQHFSQLYGFCDFKTLQLLILSY